ncbi:hypothetical protein LH427_05175 [Laribacter hongkongensis]|uniref:hypothetical protein n=2 Tax=Laribacter hongkongensis TaxID=168471 RepID=UPI001EFCFFF4|nr:hypothetical protein [Laribacter hongkongensis]MCG8991536.1 hypothetical protein [Laribacter hongkongensis]MCG8996789.1 hypothetical protein [Laribacter hongkongensis]MCG9001182.1 hypothetical protein [Laribacter hongkongensis]MCG9003122.1 hypothetical protein [Laribacter hongkongensis]MCG9007390.1 hypothetical protein [Laribacter hongkongensis]
MSLSIRMTASCSKWMVFHYMGDRKTLFKAWQIKAGAAPLCGVAFARRHGMPDGDAAFFMASGSAGVGAGIIFV